MTHWIEPEHLADATDRVMERALFQPEEIVDGGITFDALAKSIVQIYATTKSRQERGDLIIAILDEHFADLVKKEAENVLDGERKDEFDRKYHEAFIRRF